MAHTHHEDYAASEGFAAASWMMAMMAVIIFAVLAVALLVWSPWNSGTSTGTTTNGNNTEQQAPADGSDNGDGVNIEGNDVDIGDNPVPNQ